MLFKVRMAQVDLKNATITIEDGSAQLIGATTVTSNASSAAVTLAVTLPANTIITAGTRLTVTGSTATHTVTAATGSPTTTSVTITPGLTGAVSSGATVTWLNKSVEINIGEGTLTYDEKRNMTYTKNRGVLDTVREGDQEPVDVKFDFVWEFLTTDTGEDITIEDVLKQRGGASHWKSSSTDQCEPYAVTMVITYDPPCSSAKNEVIKLKDYRWESLSHDAKAGTVASSGKCNITQADVTRV